MADSFPRTKVEVAFSTDPGSASPIYTDITSYLRQGSVSPASRQYVLDTFSAGSMELTLNNLTRAFDPSHTGSPFYPYVDVMKRCRVRADYSSDNLLSYNQSTIETDLTGLKANYNALLVRTTEQALDGDYSLGVTRGGFVDDMVATTTDGKEGTPVTVGTSYTAVASYWAKTTARSVKMGIAWFDSTGAALSTDYGTIVSDSTTAWTQATVTATAPANSVTAAVRFHIIAPGASEVHYVDEAMLRVTTALGHNTTWQPGYTSRNNLLSFNQAGFEAGSVNGANDWTAIGTTPLDLVTTPVAEGNYALRINMSGTVGSEIITPSAIPVLHSFPVTASTQYSASAELRTAVTNRSPFIGIRWYTSAGVFISDSDGTAITELTTAYTVATVTATSPSNAAFAAVRINYPTSADAEIHYVDKVLFRLGSTTTWEPGAAPFDLFNGYVDSWTQNYDRSTKDSTVSLAASDGFKVLGQRSLPSVYYQEITTETGLTNWYRLGDAVNSDRARDSKGSAHGTVHGDVSWGAGSSVYGDDDGALTINTTTDWVNFPALFGGTDPWTIGFRIKTGVLGTTQRFMSDFTAATDTWWQIGMKADGKVLFELGSRYTPGNGKSVTSVAIINDQIWHNVYVARGADNLLRIFVDSGAPDVSTSGMNINLERSVWAIGEPSVGSVTPSLAATAAPDFEIDEVTVYSIGMTTNTVPVIHGVAATIPWQDDSEGTRIGRVLDYINWPAADRDLDSGKSVLARADTAAGSALDHLQEAAKSSYARLFMDGAGRVRLIDRHATLTDWSSRSSQATYGDLQDAALTELPYAAITIAFDDTRVINDARISAQDGSEMVYTDSTSINNKYTQRSFTLSTSLKKDAEAYDYAAWLVDHFKTPLERVENISILPTANPAFLFPEVLRRRIGERVTVKRRPPGGGAVKSHELIIEGISHQFAPKQWVTSMTLSGADTRTYWILGDPVLGVLDSTTRLAF